MPSAIRPEVPAPRQHTLAWSLFLHVAPAMVAFATYVWIFLPTVVAWGLPRRVAGLMMGALILVPLLVGPLVYLGWKRNGRLSVDGVVLYRETLPFARLAVLVGALLAWAIVVLAIAASADQWLLENVFSAYPAQPDNATAGDSSTALLVTRLASLAIVGIIVPVAEEWYFRGYLLPRVAWMGKWAIVWTAVLFTVQHFHSPWQSATRILLLVPMIAVVRHTRSISVGIGVHCIGNTIGELQMLAVVLRGL